jgi:hypothetical protein
MELTQALLALQQSHQQVAEAVRHILVLAVMVAMVVVAAAHLDTRLAVMETLVLELLGKVLLVEQAVPLHPIVAQVVVAQGLLAVAVVFLAVDMAV